MPNDIIEDYDLTKFQVGEYVKGWKNEGGIAFGTIDVIDLTCAQRMRFKLKLENGTFAWCRLVYYINQAD